MTNFISNASDIFYPSSMNSRVWFRDATDGTYRMGHVDGYDGDRISVLYCNHLNSYWASELSPADSVFFHANNAELSHLNPPNIVENLRCCYQKAIQDSESRGSIYSYAGWVLLLVNPYTELDGLYDFYNCSRCDRPGLANRSAHPFAIASLAYQRMLSEKKPQSILISGESGAGKTETSKHVMKFLSWKSAQLGSGYERLDLINQRITDSNPILEFFGNAKTTRNNNSSRFGKLMKFNFSQQGAIVSASVDTFLLAKSRVAKVPPMEENYHIFYSLMHAPDALLTEIGLEKSRRYKCLSSPDTINEDTVTYSPGGDFAFDNILSAFKSFGIDEEEQMGIWKILACIILLCSLEFASVRVGEAPSGSKVTQMDLANTIGRLLGLPEGSGERIERLLCSKAVRETRSLLEPAQAENMAGSVSKGLYEALFNFLVCSINASLNSEFGTLGTHVDNHCHIGVLDIFGFENLEPATPNSLEQLLINVANERFYDHFQEEVVRNERRLLDFEGIVLPQYDNVSPAANLVVELLLGSKKAPGIVSLLDDASYFGAGADDCDRTFCRKANTCLGQLEKSKLRSLSNEARETIFMVNHFAEPVKYTAQGFVQRNVDFLSDELRAFLCSECGPHVRRLFEVVGETKAAKVKLKSLSSIFVGQVNSLVKQLQSTDCHFIRCLKPNDKQTPGDFDQRCVLRQLVTGGIIPSIELMKQGFPCRISYTNLQQKLLQHIPKCHNMSARDMCTVIIKFLQVPTDSYALGVSSALFKFGQLSVVEDLLAMSDPEQLSSMWEKAHKMWTQIKLKRTFTSVLCCLKLAQIIRHRRWKRLAEECVEHWQENYRNPKLKALATKLSALFTARRIRLRFRQTKNAIFWTKVVLRYHVQKQNAVLDSIATVQNVLRAYMSIAVTNKLLYQQHVEQKNPTDAVSMQEVDQNMPEVSGISSPIDGTLDEVFGEGTPRLPEETDDNATTSILPPFSSPVVVSSESNNPVLPGGETRRRHRNAICGTPGDMTAIAVAMEVEAVSARMWAESTSRKRRNESQTLSCESPAKKQQQSRVHGNSPPILRVKPFRPRFSIWDIKHMIEPEPGSVEVAVNEERLCRNSTSSPLLQKLLHRNADELDETPRPCCPGKSPTFGHSNEAQKVPSRPVRRIDGETSAVPFASRIPILSKTRNNPEPQKFIGSKVPISGRKYCPHGY